jgi:hypothetical protein
MNLNGVEIVCSDGNQSSLSAKPQQKWGVCDVSNQNCSLSFHQSGELRCAVRYVFALRCRRLECKF